MIAQISIFWLMYMTYYLVASQRIKDEIYESINGAVPCFRRLNATHQTGCSSPESGSVGVVQLVESIHDAEWLVKADAGPHAVLMSSAYFTQDMLDIFIHNPENVAGILVYYNESNRPTFQSEESHCPNEYTSEQGSCPAKGWNIAGSGLLQRDIPFPIFFLSQGSQEYVDIIIDCYDRFNRHDRENQKFRSLCALEFNSFMFAVTNSKECMRRSDGNALAQSTRFCEPLGDRNVIQTLYPRNIPVNSTHSTDKANSIFLVTARLDSTSIFDANEGAPLGSLLAKHVKRIPIGKGDNGLNIQDPNEFCSPGIAPGAASTVVGLVTLQVVASALSKMMPQNFTEGNVIFALFNGEAYDYIGSSRMAYDMKIQAFPYIDPKSIRLHLEIGQIGGAIAGDSWHVNTLSPARSVSYKDEIQSFVETLSRKDPKLNITFKYTDTIPPSSLHSFSRVLGHESMPHLLIVDHDDEFTNKFYHGVYDDALNVGFRYSNVTVTSDGTFETTDEMISRGHLNESSMQVKMATLAKALAETLYERMTGNTYTGDDKASAHLVDELLYCWLSNQNCRIFRAVDTAIGEDKTKVTPPAPFYVSVRGWTGAATAAGARTMALLTSQNIVPAHSCPESEPNGTFNYWMMGWNETGVCVSANVYTTEAVSPAFIISDYDMSSGLYSSWTEASWRAPWTRLLVKGTGRSAEIAGAIGATITLTTIALALLVSSRHETLLPSYRRPALPLRVDC